MPGALTDTRCLVAPCIGPFPSIGLPTQVTGESRVDGTKGVNDTTKQALSNRNVDNASSASNQVALLNQSIITEHYDTNIVRLQVQCHPLLQINPIHGQVPYLNTTGKGNHFLCLHVLQSIDTGNTISNGQHFTGLVNIYFGSGTEDFLFNY